MPRSGNVPCPFHEPEPCHARRGYPVNSRQSGRSQHEVERCAVEEPWWAKAIDADQDDCGSGRDEGELPRIHAEDDTLP